MVAIDYIAFTHNNAQRSVPGGASVSGGTREIWVKMLGFVISWFFSKNRKAVKTKEVEITAVKPNEAESTEVKIKEGFVIRILNKLIAGILGSFISINLELQGIHSKLINGEIVVDNPTEDYEMINKIIKLLTRADELFEKVNYFDNETLKSELKSSLHTSYLIETEIKDFVFANKKTKRIKDDLFVLLSAKSKISLSRAV